MNYKNLKVEKVETYAVVMINRPDKLNALNKETIDELYQAMQALAKEDAVRCVILTGAGEKAFVAGADISEITGLDGSSAKEFARRGQEVFRYIEKMSIPVIAAINGFALGGGCELAMACHLRIASSKAKFGQPEINLGIIPGYGGTQRLPRLIGLAPALKLLLSGEMIDAAEALKLGLVNEVVGAEDLMEHAQSLAKMLSGKAPVAVSLILQAVIQGMDHPLEQALEGEAAYFGTVCQTEDMKEGTSAFLQKRKPNFKGK